VYPQKSDPVATIVNVPSAGATPPKVMVLLLNDNQDGSVVVPLSRAEKKRLPLIGSVRDSRNVSYKNPSEKDQYGLTVIPDPPGSRWTDASSPTESLEIWVLNP